MTTDACDAYYQDWVDQTRALTPQTFQNWNAAGISGRSEQLLRQADIIRSRYRVSDPERCMREMDALYEQIRPELSSAVSGRNEEFPWTQHLAVSPRGINVNMAKLSDFIDPQGFRRTDQELAAAALKTLRDNYILRPMGSETVAQLEARIVKNFVDAFSMNWNRGLKPEEIIGDADFHQIVTLTSPMSMRKAKSSTSPWIWIGLALAGVGAMLAFSTKSSKRR